MVNRIRVHGLAARAPFTSPGQTNDHPMNEQMYSAMPDETSMSKPDFAGTSKKVPAA
jgi:hypothetical protein